MDYYSQDLGDLWSGAQIKEGYSKGVHFAEGILPFRVPDIMSGSESVLEIGSSFGQCYRYLLSQGIDLGPRYTGIDVSNEGVGYCADLYPQANWIRGDFLTTDLGRTFDYVVEKNAIHHMPSPLECIAKAVGLADKAITMYMRVRTLHPTLSDIESGYFIRRETDGEAKGRYFYNLVNLYELADTIRSQENVVKALINLGPHYVDRSYQDVVIPADVTDPAEETYACKITVTKGTAGLPRISVRPMRWRPFVLEGLRRPTSVPRLLKVRKNVMANNRVH